MTSHFVQNGADGKIVHETKRTSGTGQFLIRSLLRFHRIVRRSMKAGEVGMIQIDMPMPKVCDDCPFMDEDHGDYPYCVALGQNRGYTFRIREKRFPNCPLKPVEEQKEDTETDRLKNMCRVLFNRCRAVGSADGMMCAWCGMKKECEEMHSI